MKILISGTHGLIGSALVRALAGTRSCRDAADPRAPSPGEAAVAWDPESNQIDAAGLEGFDAVVHLAGENVAAGRWTADRKARIRTSRVAGTRLLSDALAAPRPSAQGALLRIGRRLLRRPRRGDSGRDQSAGHRFSGQRLPRLGGRHRARREGRHPRGANSASAWFWRPAAALGKMVEPFRLGLGGRLGSGRQYVSWITLDDVVGAIAHVLETDTLSGPVNLVGPKPVTNAEFTKALGRQLNRPTLLAVPAFALRLLFGQMADDLLLSSARVVPRRLLDSGYHFHDAELAPALQRLLGR